MVFSLSVIDVMGMKTIPFYLSNGWRTSEEETEYPWPRLFKSGDGHFQYYTIVPQKF